MGRVRVEPDAWHDLLGIVGHMADVAGYRRAAGAIADEFERKCEIYARQPEMGDIVEESEQGYRSFTFRRWYVAVYEPLNDGINVIRVFDGRSDYGRHLEE